MVELIDDNDFEEAMEATIKKMGELVRNQPANRQSKIIAMLEKEMAGLKTNVGRLLYEEEDRRKLNCQKAYEKALDKAPGVLEVDVPVRFLPWWILWLENLISYEPPV